MREYTKLCDVCDFQGGSQPPKDEWSFDLKAGYIRMLQIRDFTQSERVVPEYIKITKTTKTCEADDILIARYGASLGKILTGLAGAYNVAIMKAIPDTNMLEKKYLYYYLKSPIFQGFLLNVGSRAAQAGFNKNDLQDLLIPNITRNEQVEIVGILERVETVIEVRQKELQKLDNLLKARFIEMFGDAVDNPMGWKKRKLQEIVTDDCTISYGIVQTGNDQEDGVPVFRPVDIVNKVPKLTELKKTTEEISNKYKRTILKGRELLITVRANIADTCIVDEEFKGCNVGRGIVPIRIQEDIMVLEFLKYLLDSKHLNDDIKSKAKGITLIQLNMEDLREVELICPPIEKQMDFVEFAKQVDKSKFLCFHQKKIREIFKVSRKLIFSLKFYSACRLWCEIIQYTVDTSNFMSNTLSNMNHNFMWNFSNSFCHNVNRAYCTNNTAPFKSTFTIFNTSRLSCFFRKYFNEFSTNDFSLSFWICNAC